MFRKIPTGETIDCDRIRGTLHMQFRLQKGFIETFIDFCSDLEIILHLKIIESDSTLVIGRFLDVWGAEKKFTVSLKVDGVNLIEIGAEVSEPEIRINGKSIGTVELRRPVSDSTTIKSYFMDGRCVSGIDSFTNIWRQSAKASGKPAIAPTVDEWIPDKHGLTAIIRAKNEESTITACLNGIVDSVDEIVCVDNNSSDNTSRLMRDFREEHFKTRVYSYNIDVPRVGVCHEQAYLNDSANTLGRFYNFCLSKCRTSNFMKWDADFLPIRDNLNEMVNKFDLRTRDDIFSVWFSGVSVWTDGDRYWIDEAARYNEFRVHSKKFGAKWVDLPPWEEIDQTYLYKAQLFSFHKPVFIEIFNIDLNEFQVRGFNASDQRDIDRYNALEQLANSGDLPDRFTEVSSLDCPEIVDRNESSIDQENRGYMVNKYNSVPRIKFKNIKNESDVANVTATELVESLINPGGNQVTLVEAEEINQNTLGVFCISHAANENRRNAIRETFKKDFDDLGIPFYFVVGRPSQKNQIVGDTIYLDCPDVYESLSEKIASLHRYVSQSMTFGHVAKIDDDTWVNAYQFSMLEYSEYDYCGGCVAGGRSAAFDWHRGKCRNEQLSDILVNTDQVKYWYGGGYGYILSKRASQVIGQNHNQMRKQLYEDLAVANVLKSEMNIEYSREFRYSVEHFHKLSLDALPYDLVLVTDIPNVDALWNIHTKMKAQGLVEPIMSNLVVETDWFRLKTENEPVFSDNEVEEISADRQLPDDSLVDVA